MADTKPRLTEGDVNLSPNRRQWIDTLSEKTRALLDADAEVFLHQSLSTPCLDALSGCEGSVLRDLDGRELLDFHGNSVHQVGYANPHVMEAVRAQLDALSFSPRRYTNEPAVRLAQKLVDLAPGDLGKVLFAPGGTSAIGMALKLARVVTGRFKTVSMWDSFHGASLDAISVGGEALFRAGVGPLLPGTEHVPPAEPYRCLFNPGGRCANCGLRCAKYVEYVLEKEGDVACVLAEPVRCTTVNPPPEGYWPFIRQACDRHGALLIFDETAVCLGRTGTMFAFENFGVTPDIVTLGKGLGGGIFPLAAIVARRDFDRAGNIALGHYTHEKSPAACAAGLAAIEVIEGEGLLCRARALGLAVLDRLRAMADAHPLVGDARGIGLSMGVELVLPDNQPATAEADKVLYRCLSRGLSFKISGGNFLTLTPPLTITDEEMVRALDILETSIADVERERGLNQ
ncbi:aspartate aminotransferase family protein [Pseudodesulfovibrio sp.]|uniref:(R)-1-hydroxy-2-aminoethylphosphonate ammonia-lyase n=1 Tax=Pseudodesulfovibrio sp. TaxID=2035812 RepID=UPI002617B867|nr:aspartate aminotransferase family protein [Pseudodesulfovibrio sp.]MDD3313845.1 aspartate aminotransferase family protein [Pseudodesulfovibrio sp.]